MCYAGLHICCCAIHSAALGCSYLAVTDTVLHLPATILFCHWLRYTRSLLCCSAFFSYSVPLQIFSVTTSASLELSYLLTRCYLDVPHSLCCFILHLCVYAGLLLLSYGMCSSLALVRLTDCQSKTCSVLAGSDVCYVICLS